MNSLLVPVQEQPYYFIYGLYSTRNPNHIKYVGRSTGPRRPNSKHHKKIEEWKRSEIKDGYLILFYSLESVPAFHNLSKRERYWQSELLKKGHILLNNVACGAGGSKYESYDSINYKYELCKKYILGSNSIILAKEENCSNYKILNILKSFNITRRKSGKQNNSDYDKQEQLKKLEDTKKILFKNLIDRETELDEICNKYKNGETMGNLAKAYDVSYFFIECLLEKKNIKARSMSEVKGGLTLKQKEEACMRYLAGESTVEISKIFKTAHSTIGNALRENGIKVRSSYETKQFLIKKA